jgi:hypothetical protein
MHTSVNFIMIAYQAHCDKLILQAGGKPRSREKPPTMSQMLMAMKGRVASKE